MTVDVRRSAAKNLCYGNRTVIPTMMNWSGLVSAVYVSGEHSQVFATMMGVADAIRHYGEFGFPVEAVLAATTPGPRFTDWPSFLQNWYGIGLADSRRELAAGDVLMLLDVTVSAPAETVRRAEQLLRQAFKVDAGVYFLLAPDAQVPPALRALGNFTGSNVSYLNPFANPLVESSVYNRNPGKIHLFGTHHSLVTAAIGAMDFLARFTLETPAAQLGRRIVVDSETPMEKWGQPGSLENVLDAFRFPWIATNPANLPPAPNKVLVTPVQ